jgi:hypothetical protein
MPRPIEQPHHHRPSAAAHSKLDSDRSHEQPPTTTQRTHGMHVCTNGPCGTKLQYLLLVPVQLGEQMRDVRHGAPLGIIRVEFVEEFIQILLRVHSHRLYTPADHRRGGGLHFWSFWRQPACAHAAPHRRTTGGLSSEIGERTRMPFPLER